MLFFSPCHAQWLWVILKVFYAVHLIVYLFYLIAEFSLILSIYLTCYLLCLNADLLCTVVFLYMSCSFVKRYWSNLHKVLNNDAGSCLGWHGLCTGVISTSVASYVDVLLHSKLNVRSHERCTVCVLRNYFPENVIILNCYLDICCDWGLSMF